MDGDENYEELLQVDAFKFMCTMQRDDETGHGVFFTLLTARTTSYSIMEIIKRDQRECV